MKRPSTSSAEAIISLADVSRQFGSQLALDGVTLHVPRGCVFGLVGENGAGKTTLIRHIMGLLRAESGEVRVCGLDPVADPVGVLSRVGYLSEVRDLPMWMRVDELLAYTRAFYPAWDPGYADQLREQLGLPTKKRIGELSQGQKAKAGLVVALAYRPELLVLDEPSSGLDPVVRREMLETIIRSVANEGRTVFFSSHLLDEIERVSDQLAMIHQGRVLLSGRLDEVRERHRVLHLHFDQTLSQPPKIEAALQLKGAGKSWSALLCDLTASRRRAIVEAGARIAEESVPTLDEIFFGRVGPVRE